MAKLEDLTGQQFGKLTVIEQDKTGRSRTCWICRCECGVIISVFAVNLKRGFTKSCGCSKGKLIDGHRCKDITGQTFGRLTVLGVDHYDGNEWYWKTQCSCGNTSIVRGSHLRSGEVQSCYCLAHEKQLERLTTHGLTYTQEYKNIQGRKRSARQKYLDVEWDVEKEVFLRNYIQNCVICGISREEHKQKHGTDLHVDHIAPLSKGNGLSISNCTILCKECNHQKHNTYLKDLPKDWQFKILWSNLQFQEHWNIESRS